MKKVDDNTYLMDKNDIAEYLKNRPPLLMIDEVYVEPGAKAYTTKILDADMWYFDCHFPGNPMMPGVLQLETLFNTSAMAIKILEGYRDKTTNVARIDSAYFRKHIIPNDKIEVMTEITRFRRGVANVRGEITVSGEVCCECSFILVVLDDVVKVN